MTGLRAFRNGCGSAARSPGLILVLTGANLLLALPLAVAFRQMMETAFGSSLAPATLMEGFDATAVRDALAHSGDALRALIRTAIPTALLGMVIHTVLAGGILTILLDDQPFSAKLFFEGIGRTIGRFLRLWLVLATLGALLFFFCGLVFAVLAGAAMEASSDRAAVLGAAFALCVYFPLILVVMAGDYAKIQIVASDLRSVWKAAGLGFLFLLRNPASTLFLQLLFLLLLGFCTAVYWGLDALIGMHSAGTIAAMFIIQQLYMGTRMWIRTATYAGALALFKARRPRPVLFYGWDDSPAQESA